MNIISQLIKRFIIVFVACFITALILISQPLNAKDNNEDKYLTRGDMAVMFSATDFMKEKIFDVWFETALAKMLRDGAPAGYVTVDDKLWLEIDTKEELMSAKTFTEMV